MPPSGYLYQFRAYPKQLKEYIVVVPLQCKQLGACIIDKKQGHAFLRKAEGVRKLPRQPVVSGQLPIDYCSHLWKEPRSGWHLVAWAFFAA